MSTKPGQAHLRLVASLPGYWELRALQRLDGTRMVSRGSFFLIATKVGETLMYDRLEQAIRWADEHHENGAEVFIGMNPRQRKARCKDAVPLVTASYVDLDLPEGKTPEAALNQVTSGDLPVPSLVVDSGYGLHVVYLLHDPSSDKPRWKAVQRSLVRRLGALGADPRVAADESRVLRLVPYPNRKRWPEGVPTRLVYQSDARYDLAKLAEAMGIDQDSACSRHDVLTVPDTMVREEAVDELSPAALLSPEEMQHRVESIEGTRAVLEAWIKRTMKPGLHYGIIPIDGQEATKPTLLKPGAELIALLYGWRFHFAADLESLQMYGPGAAGIFAYVCTLIDRDGHPVGQGRGVAELREPGMNNANKAVKMALKRAQVDAILRCAGLSQWFTQDLEEPAYIAPEATPGQPAPPDPASNGPNGHRPKAGQRCLPTQVAAIRIWLQRIKRSETEILGFYELARLEDLSVGHADRVIRRLMELARQRL